MRREPLTGHTTQLKKISSLFILLLFVGGCATGAEEETSTVEGSSSPIVYGADDRTDVYAHADADWRALARESIAVMVPTYALDRSGGLSASNAGTLDDAYNLCSGQRFADQPAVGSCSGTLIAEDLILTAGHCINSNDCDDKAWVFDYYYEANGRLAQSTRQDVYRCDAVVAHELESSGVDYAIVKLDRAVTSDRKPAPVRRASSALTVGSALTLVGFPSGIPAKIANGGSVTNARARTLDYFEANVDAFGGNSGSGVFNNAGELVGILVRGAQDYRYSNGCYVVNTVREETNDGEDITYVQNALNAACQSGSVLSNTFCFGPEEEDWCLACRNDRDCDGGFVCGDAGVCTKRCDRDADCRDDHACQDRACAPRVTRMCSNGDVWGEDACGRSQGQLQACEDNEICASGACQSYDQGNTCETAQRFELASGRISGALENATHTQQGSCGGLGAEHIYAFTLSRAATLTATATGDFDTVLYLRAGCVGDQVACNDDATPPGGRGSRITAELTPGEYALIIDGYAREAAGAYQIDLEVELSGDEPICDPACQLGATRCEGDAVSACVEIDGCAAWGAPSACEAQCEAGACVAGGDEAQGDVCADALEITARSQTVNGDLRDFNSDQQGSCGGRGPEAYVRFTLLEPSHFDVVVTGLDSVAYLLNGCEAELICNDDATPPGSNGSHLAKDLDPGVYTLVIDSYAQGGAFSAELQFSASGAACEDVCAPNSGRCVGDDAQVCVEGREGCWIWSTSEACPNGCADGACVEALSGEGESCGDATLIEAATQTLQGNLASYEADLRGSCGGNGADRVYSFTLDAPATLTATSSGFDTVLYLTASCGQAEAELACNDDSTPPGSFGSRISAELPVGTYFLVLDAYRAAGEYALALEFN